MVCTVRFSLNCCEFTTCWISRRAFLVDVPTRRAKKMKIILKFLLDMSDHIVDLLDNMPGRRWKIISRPATYLQCRAAKIADMIEFNNSIFWKRTFSLIQKLFSILLIWASITNTVQQVWKNWQFLKFLQS